MSQFSHFEFYTYSERSLYLLHNGTKMTLVSHSEKKLWLKYHVMVSYIILEKNVFEVDASYSERLP